MKSRLLFGIGTAVLALACARSDAGITTSVKSQLAVDDLVRGRIDVDTRDRVVTLNGVRVRRAEKSHALEIARQVEGMTSVTDRLTVTDRQ